MKTPYQFQTVNSWAPGRLGRRAAAKDHFGEALKLQPQFPQAQEQWLALTNSAQP